MLETSHLKALMAPVFRNHSNQGAKTVYLHPPLSDHPLLTHKETPDCCAERGEDDHLEITSSNNPSYGSSILIYGYKLQSNTTHSAVYSNYGDPNAKNERYGSKFLEDRRIII